MISHVASPVPAVATPLRERPDLLHAVAFCVAPARRRARSSKAITLGLHPFTKSRFDPLDHSVCDLTIPANLTGRAGSRSWPRQRQRTAPLSKRFIIGSFQDHWFGSHHIDRDVDVPPCGLGIGSGARRPPRPERLRVPPPGRLPLRRAWRVLAAGVSPVAVDDQNRALAGADRRRTPRGGDGFSRLPGRRASNYPATGRSRGEAA